MIIKTLTQPYPEPVGQGRKAAKTPGFLRKPFYSTAFLAFCAGLSH
jgi:hypothetical protein